MRSLAKQNVAVAVVVAFNWDSLHARLNSHCKAWRYNKKKDKNIKPYMKYV